MWKLFEPYSIIGKRKTLATAWFVCLLVFGQAGILISLLLDGKDGVISNWKLGNFYTFAIALLASGLFDFAQEYYKENEIRFKNYKLVTVLLAIITMMALVAMVVKDQLVTQTGLKQLWLYCFSITLALYIYCVGLLKDEYDDYKHLDDKRTQQLQAKVGQLPNQDERGVTF